MLSIVCYIEVDSTYIEIEGTLPLPVLGKGLSKGTIILSFTS